LNEFCSKQFSSNRRESIVLAEPKKKYGMLFEAIKSKYLVFPPKRNQTENLVITVGESTGTFGNDVQPANNKIRYQGSSPNLIPKQKIQKNRHSMVHVTHRNVELTGSSSQE